MKKKTSINNHSYLLTSAANFSTFNTDPTSTLYCFPPVLITANFCTPPNIKIAKSWVLATQFMRYRDNIPYFLSFVKSNFFLKLTNQCHLFSNSYIFLTISTYFIFILCLLKNICSNSVFIFSTAFSVLCRSSV